MRASNGEVLLSSVNVNVFVCALNELVSVAVARLPLALPTSEIEAAVCRRRRSDQRPRSRE
jgi:hypothetical protein